MYLHDTTNTEQVNQKLVKIARITSKWVQTFYGNMILFSTLCLINNV